MIRRLLPLLVLLAACACTRSELRKTINTVDDRTHDAGETLRKDGKKILNKLSK
jgi:hypothetical protein